MSTRHAIFLLLLALGCDDKDSAHPDSHPPGGHSDTPDSTESDPPQGDSPPDTQIEDSQVEDTGDTGGDDPLPGCLGQPNPGALGPETCVAAAPCSWHGDTSYSYFGWGLSAGDLDGDGLADLVSGSFYYDVPTMDDDVDEAGRVQVVLGASLDQDEPPLVAELYGVAEDDMLGYDLAIIGDVDGDGLDDLLVGARGADNAATDAGAAYLLPGPPEDWPSGTIDAAAQATFFGPTQYGNVGQILCEGGDVDGDGLADMLISGELYDGVDDRATGCAYLVYGREKGWSGEISLEDADATMRGTGSLDQAGMGSVLQGDFDGDGYADPAIGSPYGNGYYARVSVWTGGPGAVEGELETDEAPAVIEGEGYMAIFGWALAAGDLNGDGTDELVVGAPYEDNGYDNGGQVFIYAGDGAFFDGPQPLGSYVGAWDDEQLGTGLATGDINGDGMDELLMGAVAAYAGIKTKSGRSSLVWGHASDWAEEVPVEDADASFHGVDVNDYLGAATALGDFDGDGRHDLLFQAGCADGDAGADAGAIYLFWGE